MQEQQKVKAKIRVVIEKYHGEPSEGSQPFEVVEREYEQEIMLPVPEKEESC